MIKRSIKTKWLLAFIFIGLQGVIAQSSSSTGVQYEILLAPETQTVAMGKPIKIMVELKNISNQIINVYQDKSRRAIFTYKVKLVNETGDQPKKTNEYSALSEESNAEPSKQMVIIGSGYTLQVKPGDGLTDTLDLDKIYQIEEPGTYSIMVEREDHPSGAIVKSNTVTVTVTR